MLAKVLIPKSNPKPINFLALASSFKMGGLHKSHDQAFVIPSVDISAYLTDPNSKEGNKVIEQVRDACRTSGFFQITGHGVPPSLRDSVLDAAKTFFALPSEQKVKYSGVPGRGYEKIGEQMLEPGTKPELKEVSTFRSKGKPKLTLMERATSSVAKIQAGSHPIENSNIRIYGLRRLFRMRLSRTHFCDTTTFCLH